MMVVVPPAAQVTTAWKNGGGLTTQLLVHPSGATLDNFLWRVSTARVTVGASFSHFAGVDRSLALVSGGPLRVSMAGDDDLRLTALKFDLATGAPAIHFGGERDVHAEPAGPHPVVDFNVMTRRGHYRQRQARVEGPGRTEIGADHVVLYCVAGAAECSDDAGRRQTLARGDALHAFALEPGRPVRVSVAPAPGSDPMCLFAACIDRENPHAR